MSHSIDAGSPWATPTANSRHWSSWSDGTHAGEIPSKRLRAGRRAEQRQRGVVGREHRPVRAQPQQAAGLDVQQAAQVRNFNRRLKFRVVHGSPPAEPPNKRGPAPGTPPPLRPCPQAFDCLTTYRHLAADTPAFSSWPHGAGDVPMNAASKAAIESAAVRLCAGWI